MNLGQHEVEVELEAGLELRLDRYVAEVWKLLGRSQLRQRMEDCSVNGHKAKPSTLLKSGDILRVSLKALPEQHLKAQSMDLDILYEDENTIVLNKASGLVVHPGAGNQEGTLVSGLLHHVQDLEHEDFEDETRPGIVHRLDKETSGVLVVAKNSESHQLLSKQFQDRLTKKAYLALVHGKISVKTEGKSWSVGAFIRRDPRMRQRFAWHETEGKASWTDFTLLASKGNYHLVLAMPKTGRTHQIRVHLKHSGLPIVGDAVYGRNQGADSASRCMLHAWMLAICLAGKTVPQFFEARPPADFEEFAQVLGFPTASILQAAAEVWIRNAFDS